jgi:6-phospho-beta-glucosidase
MNPMVEHGQIAQTVLDELLVAHEKYLPQFADKIAELKAAGVYPKDKVVQDLMAEGL